MGVGPFACLMILTLTFSLPPPSQSLNLYTVKQDGWVYHGNLEVPDLHYDGPKGPAAKGAVPGEGYGYDIRTAGLSSSDADVTASTAATATTSA